MRDWPDYQPTTWCPPGTCTWCDRYRPEGAPVYVRIEARGHGSQMKQNCIDSKLVDIVLENEITGVKNS